MAAAAGVDGWLHVLGLDAQARSVDAQTLL